MLSEEVIEYGAVLLVDPLHLVDVLRHLFHSLECLCEKISTNDVDEEVDDGAVQLTGFRKRYLFTLTHQSDASAPLPVDRTGSLTVATAAGISGYAEWA